MYKRQTFEGQFLDGKQPVVLLDLRSAWREGSDTTPSELLYGQTLRLPGQLIPGVFCDVPSLSPGSLPAFFRKMREQAPVRFDHHDAPKSHLPPSLGAATHIYVRHGAVRRPLQLPCDGPFEVLRQNNKTLAGIW